MKGREGEERGVERESKYTFFLRNSNVSAIPSIK